MSTLASFRSALLCAVIISSSIFTRDAAAQDDVGAPPDHPMVVAAAASLDRVLDRAVEVMKINEAASTREEVIALIRQTLQQANGEEQPDLPWLDLTKPVGMMFFYDSKFLMPGDDAPTKKSEEGDETPPATPDGIFGAVSEAGLTVNRAVAFFPVKDYQQMLTSGNLIPVPGKANCFRDGKGVEQYIRRFGTYVVTGIDGDTVDHCPDPREIARTVLGKNDLAISLQLKGLPPLLRTLGAEGIKSVYEASLQRRDDEQERDYLLRRALGDIARELLDLAMTQVEEVTLGFRLDADLKSILDLEVNGTNEGKLAKFATEMTAKKSAFDPLWNADYDQSLGISLALPMRHTKPLAAAIRNYVATATDAKQIEEFTESASVIDAACRILDANQFEMIWTGEREGDANISLFGLKLPTNREFPQQFERWLRASMKDAEQPTALMLEGLPVYQMKTIPFLADAFATTFSLLWNSDLEIPENPSYSWLIATPDAIWLCLRDGLSDDSIPSLLHRALDVKTLAADGTRNRRLVPPLRLTLHPKLWKASAESAKGDAVADGKPPSTRETFENRQAKRRGLYETHPDEISVEFVPTSRGLKLSLSLDTVYALVFPKLIADEWLGITQSQSSDELRFVEAR